MLVHAVLCDALEKKDKIIKQKLLIVINFELTSSFTVSSNPAWSAEAALELAISIGYTSNTVFACGGAASI